MRKAINLNSAINAAIRAEIGERLRAMLSNEQPAHSTFARSPEYIGRDRGPVLNDRKLKTKRPPQSAASCLTNRIGERHGRFLSRCRRYQRKRLGRDGASYRAYVRRLSWAPLF